MKVTDAICGTSLGMEGTVNVLVFVLEAQTDEYDPEADVKVFYIPHRISYMLYSARQSWPGRRKIEGALDLSEEGAKKMELALLAALQIFFEPSTDIEAAMLLRDFPIAFRRLVEKARAMKEDIRTNPRGPRPPVRGPWMLDQEPPTTDD